ncbi:unnamed protein product [Rangifer tarandus platyrhynchus]|uniref:Uncharacterized protein n=2 Tax=Rangifer tarandus platyrhynchus TaxID=3082113 RepID=A0ABN8ZXZ1_RANTA|nr:unnamed protein product [Rangifer tarandus platyrhynchus]CAI9711994.1 unnamed protein product [Rangifer tarandus platyrhynchus]
MSPSRQAGLHPPKPSLGRVVGSRLPLTAPWARECPRSVGSARPVGQPAAHPQARADPAAARARAPLHLESKFGPADGAGRPRVAGGGRSLRGDAAALAADPGSLECAFVQWSRQCQRRRVTSALSVRTRRRRRRTRPAAPRPRHAAAARTCARRRDPRAVARAGWEGERGLSPCAAAPSRKGSRKQRVDSILGLRARPLLVKLQGTCGACVLPKTHARKWSGRGSSSSDGGGGAEAGWALTRALESGDARSCERAAERPGVRAAPELRAARPPPPPPRRGMPRRSG